jgi:DNA-binding SARP family transcriptional activator
MPNEPSLNLLGSLVWSGPQGPVPLRPSKPTALAAILAAARGRPVPRPQLLTLLWEDLDEGEGRRALNTTLARLRQTWPEMPLLSVADALMWDANASATTDLAQFEEALTEGAWERAASFWRGPFLEGFELRAGAAFDEWLERERTYWTRRALGVFDRLTAAEEEARHWDRLVRDAERALTLDPLDERFHRRVMRAHYFSGHRVLALRQFQICRDLLQRELGVEPEAETIALAQAVGAGQVDGAERVPRGRPDVSARPVERTTAPFPLFGRQADLAQLETSVREAWSGSARLVVVDGEMGIGKTRLVQALTTPEESRVAQEAGCILLGHCYETTMDLPYGPLVEALTRWDPGGSRLWSYVPAPWARELARVFPGAAGSGYGEPPSEADARDGTRLLLEGMVQAVLALPKPLLFIVEDVHWADDATVKVLAHLIRHPQTTGVAVVATVRRGEVPDAVENVLRQLHYERWARRVPLGPLEVDAVCALIGAVVGSEKPPVWAARVAEETKGNPLFAIAWSRSAADPASWEGNEADAPPVPRQIQELVAGRLKRLEPVAREFLRAASVFSDPVPFECLAAVSGKSEAELLPWLERLMRVGLLEEEDTTLRSSAFCAGRHPVGPLVRFAHDLVRRAVFDGIPRAERAVLHRRAYEHFAGRATADAAELSLAQRERLAHHATAAGLAQEGLQWSLAASDAAERIFAYGEAARLLEQALANLARLPESAELFRLGIDIRLRLADMGLTVLPYRSYERVIQAAEAARSTDDAKRLTEAQTIQALTLVTQGRLGQAATVLDRVVPLARKMKSRRLLALGLVFLGHLRAVRGEFDRAVNAMEEAMPILDELGHIRLAAYARCTWASVKASLGDFDAAVPVPQALAERWTAAGNWDIAAHALAHTVTVANLQGRWADAVANAEQTLSAAARGRHQLSEYVARVFMALPVARTGALTEAIELEEAAIQLGARMRLRVLLDRAYAFLALLRLEAGQMDGAEQAARTGLDIAETDGYLAGVALNTGMLGRVLLARGDRQGEGLLQTAVGQLAALGFQPELARCHAALARLAREEEARRAHREAALALFERMGMLNEKAVLEGA